MKKILVLLSVIATLAGCTFRIGVGGGAYGASGYGGYGGGYTTSNDGCWPPVEDISPLRQQSSGQSGYGGYGGGYSSSGGRSVRVSHQQVIIIRREPQIETLSTQGYREVRPQQQSCQGHRNGCECTCRCCRNH